MHTYFSMQQAELFEKPSELPAGFRYQPELISRAEEQRLLACFRELAFKPFEFHDLLGKRRIVSFGWRYDFNGGGLQKTDDIPDFLHSVRKKAAAFAGLEPDDLQQVLLTEYRQGAAIGWHKDRAVFGDVVGISLQSACTFPLIVNQVEIHLGRLDPFYDGTLDQCLARHVTPMAWSPLGGGLITPEGSDNYGTPKKPRESVLPLIELIAKTARAYDATPAQIALAWLLKHPSRMIPIVGSVTPERIREATRADQIDLSREDWYRLLVAARGEPLP